MQESSLHDHMESFGQQPQGIGHQRRSSVNQRMSSAWKVLTGREPVDSQQQNYANSAMDASSVGHDDDGVLLHRRSSTAPRFAKRMPLDALLDAARSFSPIASPAKAAPVPRRFEARNVPPHTVAAAELSAASTSSTSDVENSQTSHSSPQNISDDVIVEWLSKRGIQVTELEAARKRAEQRGSVVKTSTAEDMRRLYALMQQMPASATPEPAHKHQREDEPTIGTFIGAAHGVHRQQTNHQQAVTPRHSEPYLERRFPDQSMPELRVPWIPHQHQSSPANPPGPIRKEANEFNYHRKNLQNVEKYEQTVNQNKLSLPDRFPRKEFEMDSKEYEFFPPYELESAAGTLGDDHDPFAMNATSNQDDIPMIDCTDRSSRNHPRLETTASPFRTLQKSEHVVIHGKAHRKLDFQPVVSVYQDEMILEDALVQSIACSIMGGELNGLDIRSEPVNEDASSDTESVAFEENKTQAGIMETSFQGISENLDTKLSELQERKLKDSSVDKHRAVIECEIEKYGNLLHDATSNMNFEMAALYRDMLTNLQDLLQQSIDRTQNKNRLSQR